MSFLSPTTVKDIHWTSSSLQPPTDSWGKERLNTGACCSVVSLMIPSSSDHVHKPMAVHVTEIHMAPIVKIKVWLSSVMITCCSLLLLLLLLFLLPAGSAAGSSAGIVFTHGPIFGFFAPQGRHVAPIKVKFIRERRTLGPLLSDKFHLDGPGVGVYGPQNWEKLEFYQYNCP